MANRQRTKGTSLAKGPVGLIGLALLAYGITALIFGSHSFTQHAPTGAVDGKMWLGLEVNGWSGLLFVAAGLLLLLGAPMHWGAKGISLIVGIALAVLCLIALANGHGAFGVTKATTPPSNPANQPGGRNDRSVAGVTSTDSHIDQKQGAIA
jgi:hypothetical protein